ARAMWLTLHAIGQVRDPSEAALLAYTRRQCKVDRLEWVEDPIPLIESLKARLLRSLPEKVTPYLREPARDWAAHMDEVWHENWSRCVGHLRLGLERRNVQLLDEWVALWELVVAQSNRKWGN
ncbi:MAG: phage protein GemA/Gp16 family protein, partial [Hydrogenophaga sp.]